MVVMVHWGSDPKLDVIKVKRGCMSDLVLVVYSPARMEKKKESKNDQHVHNCLIGAHIIWWHRCHGILSKQVWV